MVSAICHPMTFLRGALTEVSVLAQHYRIAETHRPTAERPMSMRSRVCRWPTIALLSLLGAATAGCEQEASDEAATPLARPVSYVELAVSNPRLQTMVAGSVESWKKEMIGFRVSGRVNFVREPGDNVVGRVYSEDGEMLESGTLVSSLENDRYLLRVSELEARVKSVEARAQAVRAEVEKSIPNEQKEMLAEYDRAKLENDRQVKLLQTGHTPKRKADEARAAFQSAAARLAQVESGKSEKLAELASVEAEIVQAEQLLRQADVDLEDTEVRPPFNGQVSKVHVIPGGFVEKGQPVATVQMMDPMKVQVAVSPDTDRQVNFNDVVKVYVDGESEPLNGWVWNKDAVADASTRTFMITLLVRNREIEAGLPADLDDKGAYRTTGLWNLESEFDNDRPPYFIDVEALHQDAEGYFVWKAEGLSLANLDGEFDPLFTVKKVRVKPSNRRLQYLQIITVQELLDIGDLDPKADLITSQLPAAVQDGDSVFLSRKRWLLRPGELVKVDLRGGQIPAGFYVPAQAIIKEGSGYHVFVVSEQANGAAQAKKVDVRPGDTIGTFQGIAPATEGELTEGVKLIVDGAHYLRDGDAVNAFLEAEQAL